MASESPDNQRRVVARTEDELIDALRSAAAEGVPVRLTSAGASPPEGFARRAIEVATTGLSVNLDGCSVDSLVYCGAVTATVAAGENWDDFVAAAVDNEWVGVEALSGQRGTVGEATAHNARAFGQSVGDTASGVHTWDRVSGSRRYLPMADCAFGADGSRLSRELLDDGSPRYVPLRVSFLFPQGDITAPIRDKDLLQLLEVEDRARVPLVEVRRRVLAGRSA